MTNDWGQQGVVKQGYDSTTTEIRLDHGVVNLWLVEIPVEFVEIVLPNNVNVVLAVDVQRRPVSILRSS